MAPNVPMLERSLSESRSILSGFRLLQQLSWPELRIGTPGLETRIKVTLEELDKELAGVLHELDIRPNKIRLFWKLLPHYRYGGYNEIFARDAGLKDLKSLLGKSDFDPDVGWSKNAPLYRADDIKVTESKSPILDIIEPQSGPNGDIYLRTCKTPIRDKAQVIGLLGMYEVISAQQYEKYRARKRA